MKKWLIAMIATLSLLFVACSGPESSSENEENAESATEVYDQAMQELDRLESAAFDMQLEQVMDLGDEDKVTTKADVTGKMTEDPFMMHQDGSVVMESEAVGKMEINVEVYAEEENVYVYEDMFNNWMKGTTEILGNIGLEVGEEQSPFSQVEDLGPYIEEFTFDEKNDAYTFSLKTDNEKFKELIMNNLQDLQIEMEQVEEHKEEIAIDNLEYTFTVDKDAYHMRSFQMDVDMHFKEDDEKMTATSSIAADFSDFNEIDEITIPQEVLDEAVDGKELLGF